MAMTSTKSLKSLLVQVKKAAKENGADVSKAEETQHEREAKWRKLMQQELFAKKMRFYERISLYSGGEPIAFKFRQWDYSKQANQQKAKQVAVDCHDLAERMLKEPLRVMLVGGPGVGKTSLALAMADLLHTRQKATMFVSTMEIEILESRRIDNPDVQKHLNRVIDAMKRVDVLILDDFGTEGGMKSAIKPVRKDMQDHLYAVANARMSKSTIVTTNNTGEELRQMYNDKLISRILPHNQSQIVGFGGMKDVR